MHNVRLRVKASDHELEAEGSRDFVREQYEAFKRLLDDKAPKSVLSESPVTPPSKERPQATQNTKSESFQKLLNWDNRTQQVKSTVLPDGPMKIADTVLLILLGYRELRGLTQVSALDLNEGLKAAGFDQVRLDRIMSPYLNDRLVLRSGVGKGSRYRLTTRGVKQAQELVQTLAALLPDPLP